MYTCTLTDCGLSYKADSLKEILEKLHSYVVENYSNFYTVINTERECAYKSIKSIVKPGDYMIIVANTNILAHIKEV